MEQSRRKQGAIEVARADAIQRRKAKHQEQEAARLDAPVQDEDPRAEEMGRVLADHLVLYNKEPALVVCLETVRAIISNVLDDPAEPKFRRIKVRQHTRRARCLPARRSRLMQAWAVRTDAGPCPRSGFSRQRSCWQTGFWGCGVGRRS